MSFCGDGHLPSPSNWLPSAFSRVNSPNDIIMSGFLTKTGKRKLADTFSTSRKRWFVLCQGTLVYFTNEQAEELKGSIMLEGVAVSSCGEKELQIATSMKDYYLAADAPNEVAAWIGAIEKAGADKKPRAPDKPGRRGSKSPQLSASIERKTKHSGICEEREIIHRTSSTKNAF